MPAILPDFVTRRATLGRLPSTLQIFCVNEVRGGSGYGSRLNVDHAS